LFSLFLRLTRILSLQPGLVNAGFPCIVWLHSSCFCLPQYRPKIALPCHQPVYVKVPPNRGAVSGYC
jgi:hypothetical protein